MSSDAKPSCCLLLFFYSLLFFAQQDNLQCAEVPYVHASSSSSLVTKLKRSKTVDGEKKVYFSSSWWLVQDTQGHQKPLLYRENESLKIRLSLEMMQTNLTNTHMLFLQMCDE